MPTVPAVIGGMDVGIGICRKPAALIKALPPLADAVCRRVDFQNDVFSLSAQRRKRPLSVVLISQTRQNAEMLHIEKIGCFPVQHQPDELPFFPDQRKVIIRMPQDVFL